MAVLETMQCYDDARERSDRQVIAQNERFELVERRPEPLDLTADEQLQFLSEYCSGYRYVEATRTTNEQYEVCGQWFETARARTLSEAICLAAALFNEANS